MGSLSLSVKVILLSTSVLFLSLCLKISVPLVHDFSVNQAPLLWSLIPAIRRIDSSENNILVTENLSPVEKPLVSSRFGHRKFVKASPEGGRALGVAKPKRHETLENTWKTITEGRAMPLTRHVKKSETFKDTWENHGGQFNTDVVDPHAVKKSTTFKDRTNYQPPLVNSSSPDSGKLRKEPSLSQDELNRRVEAFIKKFNEEMRLQRQESLNQYKEMTSRGRHGGIN
ncbi:CFE protein [Salix suchowensis]|nr:CFE protein [Salix suchowensis]